MITFAWAVECSDCLGSTRGSSPWWPDRWRWGTHVRIVNTFHSGAPHVSSYVLEGYIEVQNVSGKFHIRAVGRLEVKKKKRKKEKMNDLL